MAKLLVCSDKIIIKNCEIRKSIRGAYDNFVLAGNRFLLTSKNPLGHLFMVRMPGFTFQTSQAFTKEGNINYTDVSCLDGLFLYGSDNSLINYNELNVEDAKAIIRYVRKKGNTDAYFITPEGNHHDILSGSNVVGIGISIKGGDVALTSQSIKNHIRKYRNSAQGLFLKRFGIFDGVSEYDVRPSKSNERGQIEFLKNRYGIASDDVLHVDREMLDKSDVQRKILDFMNHR